MEPVCPRYSVEYAPRTPSGRRKFPLVYEDRWLQLHKRILHKPAVLWTLAHAPSSPGSPGWDKSLYHVSSRSSCSTTTYTTRILHTVAISEFKYTFYCLCYNFLNITSRLVDVRRQSTLQLPLRTVHRVPIRSTQVFKINFQRVHRSVVELVEEARVADGMGGLFERSLVLLYFYRPMINFTRFYKKK